MDNDKLVKLNDQILDKNEEILRKLYEVRKQLTEANEIILLVPTLQLSKKYLKKYKLWRQK